VEIMLTHYRDFASFFLSRPALPRWAKLAP
jgi:hypothetical protein